ncbi:MAG: hypothetical protein QOH11_2105, partial [Solirubrobacteraceae bacterium]|nr:hypothetical protein [Solirubrobacteraceae bacterium]
TIRVTPTTSTRLSASCRASHEHPIGRGHTEVGKGGRVGVLLRTLDS